jgi:VanZ like family
MRYGWPQAFDLPSGFHWAGGGWLRFTTDFGRSQEIWLNVILFVPAGVVWCMATRRAFAVLAGLVLLSAAIETVQGVLALGTPDLSDLMANTVVAVLVPIGAGGRQASLQAILRDRHAGTTVVDYERWNIHDQLGERVFAAAGVYSTGASQTASRAVVRYPTSFMGIDQCVTATWTSGGVVVDAHSGAFCDRFMG